MKTEETLKDAIWISQFQGGNEKALRDVYELFSHSLVLFATKIVADEEQARDIVSESFVKLWKRSSVFKDITNIKSFLYVITRNACLNHLRSAKRIKASHARFQVVTEQKVEPVVHQLIKKEFLDLVYNEIENLPDVARQIFKMIFIQGLKTDEISEQLGMPPKHVLNNKNRALALLKIYLFKKDLLITTGIFLLIAS
ncbi:MAG: sigma-70 family RNA polymerase sigma factor [Bacteroidetes bacterium]|nr:sigma-70 family RNA polymerase sigma factor [Bacteroidota bacterium]